jgi:serine/threonine protein kinase
LEHDLWGLIQRKVELNKAQLKSIMKQLLQGTAYLHNKKIIHRDFKSNKKTPFLISSGANILMSNKGVIKIADFGLARYVNQSGSYTSCVVTLWYRAPELLLGSKKYTQKLDIWSIG